MCVTERETFLLTLRSLTPPHTRVQYVYSCVNISVAQVNHITVTMSTNQCVSLLSCVCFNIIIYGLLFFRSPLQNAACYEYANIYSRFVWLVVISIKSIPFLMQCIQVASSPVFRIHIFIYISIYTHIYV